MSAERWRIEEPPQEEVAGAPPTMVASLAYLWAALRRRWRTWTVGALAGLLLGVAAAALMSPASSATVTLLLTHPDGTDPASAMQTDLSILHTRTVAERTVEALHSSMPPGIFQEQVQATAVTSTVLSIQVSAADPAAAVKAARTFATTYLAFRKTQLEAQSNALVAGYQNQIAAAQQQVETLTTQYNTLSSGGPATQAEAGDVLSRRSQLSAQILTLQQQISASKLATDSVAQASHVLDPAQANDVSRMRRAVLLGASGLIGGLCLGVAIVLFGALTSFRLRRREEVALAVGVPVRYAAAGLQPGWGPSRVLGRGVGRHAAAHGRALLVHGLLTALRADPRLAVVTIGRTAADDAALLVALTGIELAGQRPGVVLVDLGERPRLAGVAHRLLPATTAGPVTGPAASPAAHSPADVTMTLTQPPTVVRPEGVAPLAPGPFADDTGAAPTGGAGEAAEAAAAAEVVLSLFVLEPDTGADELPGWADRAVLLVQAGAATPEQLRTAAELLRSAGIEPAFVMLLGTDRTDESLGRPQLVGGAGVTELYRSRS
jgi:capsular polysaccharide biosynthesis protein